jgi:NAD-specific glutamate dehydrogenase
MSDIISLPVNDIAELDRRSLEKLLGQPLQADQQVCVMVISASRVADDATRRAAVENIRRTLEQVDRHRAARRITDDELDAAVDEATDHVRPRPS